MHYVTNKKDEYQFLIKYFDIKNQITQTKELNIINHEPNYNTTIKPRSNIINFNGNGASIGTMSSQSITNNGTVKLNPNTYQRPGYVFMGWNENKIAADNGQIQYWNEENITASNKTLYAVWSDEVTIQINSVDTNHNYKYYQKLNAHNYATFASQGTIQKASRDPLVYPYVNGNWNFGVSNASDSNIIAFKDQQEINNLININNKYFDLYAI